MGIYEDIQDLCKYLSDEQEDFMEHCECSEKIRQKISKTNNYELCKCKANSEHILRPALRVNEWLESPSCPLTEEGED